MMGYDREIIRAQLAQRSAPQLAALRLEWQDDQVMTLLITEAQELYHGIRPTSDYRPSAAQLETLGFPLEHQADYKKIGVNQATDQAERLATRMVLWWHGTDQYQLRRRPTAAARWSTIYAVWSTQEAFGSLFATFYSQS